MKRRGIPLLFLFIFLCSFSTEPAYSIMLRLDNAELVSRSNLVIYGVVKEIRSREENKEAVVLVECVLKGKPPAKAEVSVIFSPGLEDSPVFELNERVFLFLIESAPNLFQTTGGFQGKFSFGKQK